MAGHPPIVVDQKVPYAVVASAAELGCKHKLIDASDGCNEYTCVIAVGGALVHQHLVEDDWVEQDLSQLTLVSNKKKNSGPWGTDTCYVLNIQKNFHWNCLFYY